MSGYFDSNCWSGYNADVKYEANLIRRLLKANLLSENWTGD